MTLNTTAKAPAQPSGALRNRIIAAVLLCCIALALSSTLRSNVLFPQLPMLDSSVFQYIGIAMTKGAVPYRDTFDHKGPVIFFLNCFGKLIGDNGVWYFEFLLLLLTTVCVYRTMRKFCGRGVSLIGTAVAQFSLYYYLGVGTTRRNTRCPSSPGRC